jgi:hypothetical protein
MRLSISHHHALRSAPAGVSTSQTLPLQTSLQTTKPHMSIKLTILCSTQQKYHSYDFRKSGNNHTTFFFSAVSFSFCVNSLSLSLSKLQPENSVAISTQTPAKQASDQYTLRDNARNTQPQERKQAWRILEFRSLRHCIT